MSFFAGGRGEKDRAPDLELAGTHQVRQCGERCQATGVVTDAWCLEPGSGAVDLNRLARLEDGIEVRAQDDWSAPAWSGRWSM